MPAWFKELCLGATHLHYLGRMGLPAAPPSQPAPPLHIRLQHLTWAPPHPPLDASADAVSRHVRRHLAALPSLTSLTLHTLDWAAGPALISRSVTRLALTETPEASLTHLPMQFHSLRELDGLSCLVLRDADLRALLRMPGLRRVSALVMHLKQDHHTVPWLLPHLHLANLHVDSLALVTLELIPRLTVAELIEPTGDAALAARVAAMFRRWGAWRATPEGRARLSLSCRDFAATLASLPPFLAAAPPQQPVELTLTHTHYVALETVRQLAAALTPSVRALRLADCVIPPELWPRLLPSLPPHVQALGLSMDRAQEVEVGQLCALCRGAARAVEVVVEAQGAAGLVERARAKLKWGWRPCLAQLEGVER